MDFELVIRKVVGALEAAGVNYALIGGFAMGLRGVQRATMDLDFILMLEDMGKADEILRGFGYERIFHSPDVSQYQSTAGDWGRITQSRYARRVLISVPHIKRGVVCGSRLALCLQDPHVT